MANKDFERMIKLGEWLERFLNPDIKIWDYRELAKQFIKSYDINFGLSKNDVTLQVLELIEKQPKDIQNYYKKDVYPVHKVLNSEDPLKIKSFVIKIFTDFIKTNSLSAEIDQDVEAAMKVAMPILYGIYRYKKLVIDLFHSISKFNDSWQRTLYRQEEKEIDLEIYDESGNFIRFEHHEQKVSTVKFDYGGIHTVLSEDPSSQALKFNKEFDIDGHHVSKEYIKNHPDCDSPSHFPWNIAISRVFFDFLKLGGQDYFLFCEHCGRFTAIQRKGRKKFCSDICRSNNRFTK